MKQSFKFEVNIVRDQICHPVGDLLAGHVEVRHHRLPDELVFEIVLVHLGAVDCYCRDTTLGLAKKSLRLINDYPLILGSSNLELSRPLKLLVQQQASSSLNLFSLSVTILLEFLLSLALAVCLSSAPLHASYTYFPESDMCAQTAAAGPRRTGCFAFKLTSIEHVIICTYEAN